MLKTFKTYFSYGFILELVEALGEDAGEEGQKYNSGLHVKVVYEVDLRLEKKDRAHLNGVCPIQVTFMHALYILS